MVKDFFLFQSDLKPAGAVYTKLIQIPLANSGAFVPIQAV
jgi:hypothetical protein